MDVISSKYGGAGAVESRIGGRAENQDHYCWRETPLGLLVVVCDGMGGGPAGKTASSLAAETIADCVGAALPDDNPGDVLSAAIVAANSALNDAIAANYSLKGMGTTCVCLLLTQKTAYIAHVGDSRCYQLRKGKIKFRTSDHSQVAELVKLGTLTEEQARVSPYSNIITRAIGIAPIVEPEIDRVTFRRGDRFVLMSDGVWGTVNETILVAELTETSSAEATVKQMAERTDRRGHNKGGRHDNLTIAVVDAQASGSGGSVPVKPMIIVVVALCLCAAGVAAWLKLRGGEHPDSPTPTAYTAAVAPGSTPPANNAPESVTDQVREISDRIVADNNQATPDVTVESPTTVNTPQADLPSDNEPAVNKNDESMDESLSAAKEAGQPVGNDDNRNAQNLKNSIKITPHIENVRSIMATLQNLKPKDSKGKALEIPEKTKDKVLKKKRENVIKERATLYQRALASCEAMQKESAGDIQKEVSSLVAYLRNEKTAHALKNVDSNRSHTTGDGQAAIKEILGRLDTIQKMVSN